MSAINIYNSSLSPELGAFKDHNEPFPLTNLETVATFAVVFVKCISVQISFSRSYFKRNEVSSDLDSIETSGIKCNRR